MKPADVGVAAERLRNAYDGVGIAPMRDVLEASDLEGAYRVQDSNTDYWIAEGRVPVGWKVGLTSPAIRDRLGVAEPDCGVLFADMQIGNGGSLTHGAVALPRVEAEIALVLSRDIDEPDLAIGDIARRVGFAAPAIEVAGSRILDWAITGADTIADNASAGAFSLGYPVAIESLGDLSDFTMQLAVDGREIANGVGREAFGGPLESLRWLASAVTRRGKRLLEGDIVLTGALAPMREFEPGTTISVDLGPIGCVSLSRLLH